MSTTKTTTVETETSQQTTEMKPAEDTLPVPAEGAAETLPVPAEAAQETLPVPVDEEETMLPDVSRDAQGKRIDQ